MMRKLLTFLTGITGRRIGNGALGILLETAAVVVLMLGAFVLMILLKVWF